ncbi:unnamed protein product [Rotaria magnacalcarata]|uniref:NAD(P)(+)--arginine ADP-ribosyltransferase n=2 Tax=Rotaria magnacalcarata TaxID=392030 RepID=A0A816VVL0_9BILA|nr:unnamed protein product [Rotaria magnacalcarata]CAF4202562.1 unnamed protein product [Rotaria magnacalcarata]
MKRSIKQEEINESKDIFTFNTDEDLTIVWFDDSIDDGIRITLEQAHDHVKICHSFDEMTSTIDNIRNEKIILITAGRYSREVLFRIHDNEKIDTIYIFCLNVSLYQDLIDEKKYSRLIGIYAEYESLFTIVKQQIHLILKHLSIFNLFNHNDKPIRDLEHESNNYLWYQLFRDTLMTMHTETEQCKQQLIDYCRSYYRSNKKFLEDINTFEQTYKSSDAIYWYTKDSFLYRFVNKALRTEDIEALFRLRYFLKDLCKNLKLLFDDNFQTYQESLEAILVYRGLTLPIKVIDQIKQSVGRHVSTNGFLSTTFKRDVAEMFGANVIFEIKIETDLKNIIYGYIARMSVNPSEDEVLFDLGAIFQIKNVQYKDDKYIVSMIGIDNNIEYLKSDYFEIEREYLQDNLIDNILSNINAYSFFGKFLLTIGSNKKAIEYFEELYRNSLSDYDNKQLNEYETYIITGNLADAYAQNGQYDLALKYALESYKIHKNFVNNYSVSIAVSLLRLSLICLTNKETELAFNYIQEALQNLPTDSNAQLLGPIHLCLSKCYLKQGNYSEALNNCRKSLEKFTETKNSIALSETHCTLAKIYKHQSHTNMSIEHYEQSLLFQKNIYSNSHPLRLRICDNLAEMYYSIEKYDLSIYYCLEILNNKKINNENEDIDMVYNRTALCYLKLKQYNLAIQNANLSLAISEKSLDIERIELSYLLMGDIFYQEQNYSLAAEYYEKLVRKSIEYNSYEIMKNARSQYMSTMTHLIVEQYDKNFEHNMKILSEFSDKYLYNGAYFNFNDLHQIIILILLIYTKAKQHSLCVEQFRRMLTDIENIPDSNDKYRVLFFLNTQIGRLYEKTQNYHLAINQYEKTLSKIKNLDNQSLTSHIIEIALRCYEDIGQLYYQLNEYNLAMENQLEGLKLIEKSNNNEYQQEMFDFNYTIANCFVALEDYDLALIHYIKCVEIEKTANINVMESDESIYMYEHAGNFYYKNKQYDLAMDCYQKGLTILQLQADQDEDVSIDIVEFNYKIGCCYNMQQNMELFIEHFQIALKIQEETNHSNYNKVQAMDMNFQLGWFYQQNQSYDLAIAYFQKMLTIQQALNIDDKSYIADSYVRIGKCYEQKSMSHLSLNFYEKALELYNKIIEPNTDEQEKIADIHRKIGKIYKSQQDWNSSIEHYQHSLKFLLSLTTEVVFDLYSELGFCYQQISNGEIMAIDYYKKAIDINPYNNSEIVEFYYQLGVCYQKLEDFSSAIEYFQIIQEQLDKQEDFVKLVDVHAQIGFCFCNIQDWNSSVDHCLIAFGIYRSIEIENISLIYRLCRTIAHCYGQKEIYESAMEYFEQALTIQENQNNHNGDKKWEMIHLNNQLGFCYLMSEQYDMAYYYYDRSIETAKNSSFYTNHSSMSDNYEMLGYIYIHYGEKILAKNCFNKVIKLLNLSESINLVELRRIRNILKHFQYYN